jgi:serine/threonine protein kinase
LSGRLVQDDEIIARAFPQRLGPPRTILDINSRVITEIRAIGEIRESVTKSDRTFELIELKLENGYPNEFVRLADLALKKCRLFTPFEPYLTFVVEDGLGVSSQEWHNANTIFKEAHKARIVRLSRLKYVEPSHILTLTNFQTEFSLITHIHTGPHYDVFKATSTKTGRILCWKTVRQRLSTLFEAQGPDECFGKLCFLKNTRFDNVLFMVRSTATDVHFAHNYYDFTLETLLASGYALSSEELKRVLYTMIESVRWLWVKGYLHLALKLDSFLVSRSWEIKLGGLTHTLRSTEFKILDEPFRNFENWSPECLLGDRRIVAQEKLMVWNLGVLLYRVISGQNLFTPKFRFPYSQLSAIKTVLGSPPETVRKEWLSLPLRMYAPKRAEDRPSILNERMDIEFPPGTEDLKEMIRNMIDYDPEKRITLQQCLRGLSLPPIHNQEGRLSIVPECPSMDFLSESRRELPTVVIEPARMLVPPLPIRVRERHRSSE